MKNVWMVLMAIVLISSAAQADLRAYWAFDEGSGDYAFDASAYSNDGALIADAVAGENEDPLPGSTKPDWITGVNGGALQFCAGTDNYNSVWVAKSDSLQYLGSAFSFALWVRQDSRDLTPGGSSGYARVLSTPNYEIELGVSGWEYDYFWPYGGNNSQWQTDIGTSYIGAGGSTGQWYHMAVVYDGTNIMKYLNGTLVPDSVHAIAGPTLFDEWQYSEAALKLACQTYPNKDWFIGALDDVAIWGDQYLTAEQVQGLYDGTYTPLTVPEPATLVLLSLGGVLLRRKR